MILQRYIFRELVAAFLLVFIPITFIALVGMLFQILKLVPSTGFSILLEAIPIAVVYMAPWVLALSTCTAATLVYGRMAAENELDAVVTSGIHPRRLFTPVVVFGLLLCAISFALATLGSPRARHHRRILLRKSLLLILQSPPHGNQTFKVWGKYTLSYVNSEDGVLERPVVVEVVSDGVMRESFAKSGRVVLSNDQAPEIILVNGEVWETTPTSTHRLSGQGDVRVRFEIENLYARSQVPAEMSNRELRAEAKRIRNQERKDRDYERLDQLYSEYQSRYARGAAPMFLIAICAALGVFVRKGSRLAGLGVSMPPFLVYVVADLFFHSLGNQGRVSPLVSAWAPNAILASIGALLVWKVWRR